MPQTEPKIQEHQLNIFDQTSFIVITKVQQVVEYVFVSSNLIRLLGSTVESRTELHNDT